MIPVHGVTHGMKKRDISYFINEAKLVHGEKYDYTKSVYINSRTKTTVTCQKHGDFEIRPYKHLFGQGCRKCYNDKCSIRFSKTPSEFIEDARKVHGGKFDYSLVKYKNQESRIKIICPSHGVFEQRAKDHIARGNGCAKCSQEKNSGWTTRDWKKRIDGGKLLKLYYIECWNENEHFYKIGLTCKNKVEDRFHGVCKMPYNYKIIQFMHGRVEDLVELERNFKRNIIDMNDKYLPKIKFSGSTYECFGGKFVPNFKEIALD